MTETAFAAKKADLLRRLQLALELEWSTLPPYLVALMSIRRPKNREAAELIRGVAMEEMLHLALVANVMNAIGGAPRIARDNCPRYPLTMTFEGRPFADRTFPIDLARFSRSAIETFMKIEQPQRPKPLRHTLDAKIEIPAPTIGEFYQGIEALLDELDAEAAGALFNGDPRAQLEADFYWGGGGGITIVSDLKSAKTALTTVVEQGEGSGSTAFEAAAPSNVLGHYQRFNEILHGRLYKDGEPTSGEPTGPAIDVDYASVHPIKTNATSGDYSPGSRAAELNEAFNRQYTMMLRQLGQAINGHPNLLYASIMNGMRSLAATAGELMRTPLDDDAQSETASPTFEWLV
jgi:hypothetical protein